MNNRHIVARNTLKKYEKNVHQLKRLKNFIAKTLILTRAILIYRIKNNRQRNFY